MKAYPNLRNIVDPDHKIPVVEWTYLASIIKVREIIKGQHLYNHGEISKSIFFVLSGGGGFRLFCFDQKKEMKSL